MSFIDYKNIPLDALTCWPVDVFDRPSCPDGGRVVNPKYSQVRGAPLCPSDEAPMNAPMRACSVAKSCPALCNPEDCSPSGSSVHGTSQARILEWVATSFSRGSNPHLLFGKQILYHRTTREAHECPQDPTKTTAFP